LEAMASTQSEKVNVYKPTGRFNTKKESLKGNVRVYLDRQQANLSFHSHKPISAHETTEGVSGVLFYKNGSNRGLIKMIQLERHNNTVKVGNGLGYWKWTWSTSVMELGECDIKDFVVLLQKEAGEEGENTVVTKEWSPAMLEHYACYLYSACTIYWRSIAVTTIPPFLFLHSIDWVHTNCT
jgi:hypothetical protein